ncbi:MAG TPA: ParB/RepB/Spo0J family partition protein [Steroidobacteraceae bacterium]|jgi:ParB family chromosome partitioning protein
MNETFRRDSGSFVTADPFRCRIWKLSDRLEEYVTESSCRDEIESVARDGQLIPAIGRPIENDPDFDIEVICGTRRLFVAQRLKIPLRVELRELTDRQAAVAAETANSLRKQTSPYERGVWLDNLIKQNLFRSPDEMARDLGITPTHVTRLLKFTELPAIVLGAFASPHDILESWAVELAQAWNDGRCRRLLATRAHALDKLTPRPPAVSIYEILMAARYPAARSGRRSAGRLVKAPGGQPLLRIERQRNDLVLRIPNALLDSAVEKALVSDLIKVLSNRIQCDGTATAA